MSEREPPGRGAQTSQADRTLLGVAPPRVESTNESPLRSPVFVRSGTSVADVEPPPLPRMALPSRPPSRSANEAPSSPDAPADFAEPGRGVAWAVAVLKLPARVAGRELALWQVLAPGLAVVFALGALLVSLLGAAAKSAPAYPPAKALISPAAAASAAAAETNPSQANSPAAQPAVANLAALAAKAPETLSSSELLTLAEGRVERQREAAKALRQRLEANPALAKGKDVQAELFHLVTESATAGDALLAMTRLEPPLGADLLYEVWTGTTARTETTELARALLYSTDVRPKASPALSVALELRSAESCEAFKAALPQALKDGDRRALHLLTKLTNKRGCGPKKSDDCFACLRDQADELTATINAAKSRRPPSYPAP